MMKYFAQSVVALLLASSTLPEARAQTREVIESVAARARAIDSGRIAYRFVLNTIDGDRIVTRKEFPECRLSFTQSSWALRTPGDHVTRINHDGAFLEFVRTPQPDKTTRTGLTILPIRMLRANHELNSPPVFGGSVWFDEQLRYIVEHAGAFRARGRSRVDSIETEAWELEVPAADYRKAFYLLTEELHKGGFIRLYVAAELGFVLPLVEFTTPSHEVVTSYAARDFVEVAPGVWFPQFIASELHRAAGRTRFRAEFTTQCELINQAIPEKDFELALPANTRVQDARQAGEVINFTLDDAIVSGRLMHGRLERAHASFWDRWFNAILLGAITGAVAATSLIVSARRNPPPHQRFERRSAPSPR